MGATTLPESASDAIARMAAGMRVAPYRQLAHVRPTARDFLLRHGMALVRIAVPVLRMFYDMRTRLGAVRNSDDVWTVVEEMRPWNDKIMELALDDDWESRARDLPNRDAPNRFGRPEREAAAARLTTKYRYAIDLFLSSPHVGGEQSRKARKVEAETAPFLRRLAEYLDLIPTLLMALRFDGVFPMLSERARSTVHQAGDDALDELISFALALEGKLDPPPGLELPEPMPIFEMADEWEKVLERRRVSDVAS